MRRWAEHVDKAKTVLKSGLLSESLFHNGKLNGAFEDNMGASRESLSHKLRSSFSSTNLVKLRFSL